MNQTSGFQRIDPFVPWQNFLCFWGETMHLICQAFIIFKSCFLSENQSISRDGIFKSSPIWYQKLYSSLKCFLGNYSQPRSGLTHLFRRKRKHYQDTLFSNLVPRYLMLLILFNQKVRFLFLTHDS
jgi:hypothetical protein